MIITRWNRYMVSWNKSFAAAFKIIGYSIGWWVGGIILFFIGLNKIGNLTGVFITGKAPDSANLLIGLILMTIGYVIAISGTLAAFMKVFTELLIEESNKSKYEEELNNFEDDINLKSEYADKWYNKGIELSEIGQDDEALKAYKKVIEIKPDYADAWFNRACIFSTKGEKEKALFDLKKAIELEIINKLEAKDEQDFQNLWNDKDFINLIK